ncbi:MAG: neutral/alkaline non-lysosomal ceramidase N-terminal domain-containing protein [Candidatus Hydrogenedentes bacterium]|nr:neutral/alkaline non-lysosomal ceramidase N-terminal domain-containing protein [Candidatus Hydrogenedentota bacterium]
METLLDYIKQHKILTILLILFLIVVVLLIARRRGPFHSYTLDLAQPKAELAAEPSVLRVGVAKRDINPDFALYDAWTDVDNNGKFDEDVDTFEDRNGNGDFDGVWMAGFSSTRPATGYNDPPWVRAIAYNNNGATLVMVTIDSIGIYHNDYIRIRKAVDPTYPIDHITFSATHSHELPDTMKIWSGPGIPTFGYREDYMDMVREKAVEAIQEAVDNLAPADMYCAKVHIEPEGFVDDSRKPNVLDNNIYMMRFTKAGTEESIATVVNWGNHPETLGGRNTLLTSDFPHYLREGVEKGVPEPNGVEGFGGMCLYFQGQVGGLMTQLHTDVPHRDGQRIFSEASFDKAQALGENLALVACKALRDPAVMWKNENPMLAIRAKTILAPLQGLFAYGIMLGMIHEGYYTGGYAKTEVNVLRIGDVVMLTIPGEIYPEIVEGGIEAKPGRDYEVEPVEVPPLRTAMEAKAKMAFIIGLANDEIGYIIPKSQWDVKEPFVYTNSEGKGTDQYGEENSGGPDVAGVIHKESMALLSEVNATFK